MDADSALHMQRTIPNMLLSGQVKRLIRQGDVGSPELPQCAETLHRMYLNTQSFSEALQRYVDLSNSIDQLTPGPHPETLQQNKVGGALLHLLQRSLIRQIHARKEDVDRFQSLIHDLQRQDEYPKVIRHYESLLWMLDRKYMVTALAQTFEKESNAHEDDDFERIPLLLDAARDLRRYGIKSCIVPHMDISAVLHENGARELLALAGYQSFSSDPVPLITQEFVRTHHKINLHPSLRQQDNGGMLVRNYQGFQQMTLDDRGELLVGEWDNIPARPIFAQEGAAALHGYDQLRLILSLRFFDLVVPLEVTRDARRRHQEVVGHRETSERAFPDSISIILPRIRALEAQQNPRLLLEQEVEEGIKETRTRTRKPMRSHDVVWQIRKLPEGYTHSPQAAEHARRLGIALAKHETFVRSHLRGTGAGIKSHKVQSR